MADDVAKKSEDATIPQLVINKENADHVTFKESDSKPQNGVDDLDNKKLNQNCRQGSSDREHSSNSISEADLADFDNLSLSSDVSPEKTEMIERRRRRFKESNSVNADLALPIRRGRTRSLYGVSPSCRFGPKASIMKNQANLLTIQDPGSQRLTWYKPPLSVLVIKKIYDDDIIQPFKDIISWLIMEKNMVVFIESKVLEEAALRDDEIFSSLCNKLRTFNEGEDDLTDKVDFIISLGGDGTLLYASSIFQQSVPPIMSFHLGSLGFLTPFEFYDFREKITQVMEGNAALILRSRLKCVILLKDHISSQKTTAIKNVESRQHILVLNEVVIDRGPSPFLCHLDLYIEGRYVTSVQGDGLIISTPTGSTAYAAAAGASMVHPSVPTILITPICAHSLSFRPIVVPAGVEIKVMISPNARNTAWVSFDGRNRQEIAPGDNLRVSTSIYPVPSLCSEDQIGDWFASLCECLHWNTRRHQKPLSNPDVTNSSISLDSSSDTNGSGL